MNGEIIEGQAVTDEEMKLERALAVREAVGALEMIGAPAEALAGVYAWMAAEGIEGDPGDPMATETWTATPTKEQTDVDGEIEMLVRGAYAALAQAHTFKADVAYARRTLRDAVARIEERSR